MRRSLDGLAVMTREIIWEDPLSGHLFVFFNRRRDRVSHVLPPWTVLHDAVDQVDGVWINDFIEDLPAIAT